MIHDPRWKSGRAAPQSSPVVQLLRSVKNILAAEDASFKGLATAAGLDPKVDFRNVELNGVPLADQDLSGFDFSGADLRDTGVQRAKRDRNTIFTGARFSGPSLDPRVIELNQKLKGLRYRDADNELKARLAAGDRSCACSRS